MVNSKVLLAPVGLMVYEYARCENKLTCFMCFSCIIPTADEYNHLAMGMLHPHGNATCILYVTLC